MFLPGDFVRFNKRQGAQFTLSGSCVGETLIVADQHVDAVYVQIGKIPGAEKSPFID